MTLRGKRMEEFLDRLWNVYNGPLFVAGLELLVAARTEPALKDAVDELTVRVEARPDVEPSAWDGLAAHVAGRAVDFPGLRRRPRAARQRVAHGILR